MSPNSTTITLKVYTKTYTGMYVIWASKGHASSLTSSMYIMYVDLLILLVSYNMDRFTVRCCGIGLAPTTIKNT